MQTDSELTACFIPSFGTQGLLPRASRMSDTSDAAAVRAPAKHGFNLLTGTQACTLRPRPRPRSRNPSCHPLEATTRSTADDSHSSAIVTDTSTTLDNTEDQTETTSITENSATKSANKPNIAMPQDIMERYKKMSEYLKAERRIKNANPQWKSQIESAAEINAKRYEPLNVIYAYPNSYPVGICSLGYQLVYTFLCDMFGTHHVSRFFTDSSDRLQHVHVDLLGFSLSWELDYVNMLQMIESLQIPKLTQERDESSPVIFGGGPVLSANPEPFAEYFDVIFLGDGEELVGDFMAGFQRIKAEKPELTRRQLLMELAKIPGVYVPQLYEITYHEGDRDENSKIKSKSSKKKFQDQGQDGSSTASCSYHIASIQLAEDAISAGVPSIVQKRTFRGNQLASSTIVTEFSAWENIYMVEAVRSCPEMCRFCLASYVTLPFRAADVENALLPAIERGLTVTDRLGILGASITQHPHWDALVDALSEPKYDHVRISLSSVRTNTLTVRLAQFIGQHGSKSVTIAVESGSERVREIVNKKLKQEEISQAIRNACRGGLSSVKLYGMAGIPGETDEDIQATIDMFVALKSIIKEERSSLKLVFGCSTFVPKAQTPFQYFGVRKEAEKRMKTLEKQLAKLGVEFRPESHKWSVVQGLISRGDRRIRNVLEQAIAYGDTLGAFNRAFKDLKGQLPPMDHYCFDDWPVETVLPWAHLRTGIAPEIINSHFISASKIMAGSATREGAVQG